MPYPRIASIPGCLIVALVVCLTPALAEDLFPDKGLEAAVRAQVFAKRYNEEPLTQDDVKRISEVRGKGKSIKSLEGLQHCVEVQLIDLEDNEIADLTPIADLKLLLSINLAGNQVESIEALKDLERVQYLELSSNKVKDIAPLSKLTNMRSLYLSGNEIADLAPLKKLTKVWTLYIAGNPVQDFAPIGDLKWLSSFDASECKIEKLDFLNPLTELKTVMLENNEIKDLSPLVEMAKGDSERRFAPFWRLYLKGNPLDGEGIDAQLSALKELGARIQTE